MVEVLVELRVIVVVVVVEGKWGQHADLPLPPAQLR